MPEIKFISIILPALILITLAIKKPNFGPFFEFAGLFGIFLFSLFIPVKDGIAITGMVITIIFFISYRIAKRDFTIPKTGFNLPVLIYTGIVLASFLWTYSIMDSINEGGEIFYFVAFFFAATGLLTTRKRIMVMVNTFLFSISAAIIFGFIQGLLGNAIHSGVRVTGLIGNWTGFPVQVSYGIILILSVCLLKFGDKSRLNDLSRRFFPDKVKTFFFSIILILGFVDIVMSKARSAWIGVIPAIFVLMYLKSKKVFVFSIIILIMINAGFLYMSGTFRNRVFSMFNPAIYKMELKTHGDIESHIALVKSAWAVFEKYPLTGVGVGAFSKYFDRNKDVRFPWYYNPRTGEKLFDLYDNWPENGYMQTLAETGIFSFIALMWFFIEAVRKPFRSFKNTEDGFKRGISAFAIGSGIVFYGSFTGVANMSNNEITNLWLFILAIFVSTVMTGTAGNKEVKG